MQTPRTDPVHVPRPPELRTIKSSIRLSAEAPLFARSQCPVKSNTHDRASPDDDQSLGQDDQTDNEYQTHPTADRAHSSHMLGSVQTRRVIGAYRSLHSKLISAHLASKDSVNRPKRKTPVLIPRTHQSNTIHLRPAPSTPHSVWPSTQYAPSSDRYTSPSPGQDTSSHAVSAVKAENEVGLVEIPRFKKRELNLSMVHGAGLWRTAWAALWSWWVVNGLLSTVSRSY